MERKCFNFWIGLGLGSVLGAIVYRCCQTSKAKQLKEKVSHAFHVATDQAEDLADTAEDKIKDAGTKVADKVADKTDEAAYKAEEAKNKFNNFADNVKK